MALFLKVSPKLARPLFISEVFLGIAELDDQPLLLLKKEFNRELQFQAGFQSLSTWKKKNVKYFPNSSVSTLRKNIYINVKRYFFAIKQ